MASLKQLLVPSATLILLLFLALQFFDSYAPNQINSLSSALGDSSSSPQDSSASSSVPPPSSSSSSSPHASSPAAPSPTTPSGDADPTSPSPSSPSPTPTADPNPNTTDVFLSHFKRSPPYNSPSLLQQHIDALLSSSPQPCAPQKSTFLSTKYHPTLIATNPLGLGSGSNACRGKSSLFHHFGLFVSHHVFGSWTTGSKTDVLLYPCGSSPHSFASQIFPYLTFHASLRSSTTPGTTLPITLLPAITSHVSSSTGIRCQLLTFYPLLPGSNHVLDVRIRWSNDFARSPNDPLPSLWSSVLSSLPADAAAEIQHPDKAPGKIPSYEFFGESEKRQCRGPQMCATRAGVWGASPNSCADESTVVQVDVTVAETTGPGEDSFSFEREGKKLPLALTGEDFGLPTYIRVDDDQCGVDRHPLLLGDACAVSSMDPKSDSPFLPGNYAFQPSNKRLIFYPPGDVAKCFEQRNLNGIALVGCSQVRALYGAFPKLLGSEELSASDFVQLKDLLLQSGNKQLRVDDVGGSGVFIHYVQEWGEGFGEVEARFEQAQLFKKGGPDVFIYNAGMSHKNLDIKAFFEWWMGMMEKEGSVPPRVRIFVGQVSLQGLRNVGWSKTWLHAKNEAYRNMAVQAGFAWLDMEAFTMGVPVESSYEQDGYHYNKNVMQNSAMAIINMICNADVHDFDEDAEKWYQGKLETKERREPFFVYHDEEIKVGGKKRNVELAGVESGKRSPANVNMIPYTFVGTEERGVGGFDLWANDQRGE